MAGGSISVEPVRFEHHDVALGIGESRPRLTWIVHGPAGWRQARYAVRVVRAGGDTRIFDVTAAGSVLEPWPDSALESRERVSVSVRVAGADGSASDWSQPADAETGLLEPTDWIGAGIKPGWPDVKEGLHRRPPRFRREFTIPAPAARARLYVTAHGLYEMEINGQRVGQDALSPGWTVYPYRLRYYTYDVTSLLQAGENCIGAWMGDGWWRGRFGFHGGTTNIYGDDIALLAQLEITCVDGELVTVVTDTQWRGALSPIRYSNLYDGEVFDAHRAEKGWSRPGFADTEWDAISVAEFAPGTFVSPSGPPVRCTEEIRPTRLESKVPGTVLLDFGQNFAGRVRLRASSGVSPEVVIRHAEVLVDGQLYTRTLRDAVSVDRYVGSDGSIDWEPRFTIHGFRYAEISGIDSDTVDIVGRVYHSDMRRTGWLETSDESINKLHENIVWSMRSNFVDIPTDCPQRDERLGWTGDIQVFAPTASYLYDCSGFLSSWLQDVAVEQQRFGTVPWYVPVIPGAPQWTPIVPGALWGDVAALTPAVLYERFADTEILRRQYPSARQWVDQVERLAGPGRLWDTGMQLGDWLDPSAPPDNPAQAMTDQYYVATAYFCRSATVVADMAAVLGRRDDAERYRRLSQEVKSAIRSRWFEKDGALREPTQTGYAIAIMFDLCEDVLRAGRALADLVRSGKNRIAVGFAGVNLICDALVRGGQQLVAFDLLFSHESPSWLSMVDKGATTMWERWDSLLDDGSVNSGEMTSFNHYALGSIADWMHRQIGGIQPLAPGYRRVRIAPRPDTRLSSARATLLSPYGEIACAWFRAGETITVEATIPVGVEGVIDVHGVDPITVESGHHVVTGRI
jgi:alpha-L-rhamnosidase